MSVKNRFFNWLNFYVILLICSLQQSFIYIFIYILYILFIFAYLTTQIYRNFILMLDEYILITYSFVRMWKLVLSANHIYE